MCHIEVRTYSGLGEPQIPGLFIKGEVFLESQGKP